MQKALSRCSAAVLGRFKVQMTTSRALISPEVYAGSLALWGSELGHLDSCVVEIALSTHTSLLTMPVDLTWEL